LALAAALSVLAFVTASPASAANEVQTVRITASSGSQSALSAQPAPAVRDCTITAPDAGACTSTSLKVGTAQEKVYVCSDRCEWVYRYEPSHTLLFFDTANAVPAGAEILSATLTLYLSSGGSSFPITAHAISRTWSTDTTWTKADAATAWTRPGGDFGTEVASQTARTAGQSYSWDLTALVADWAAGRAVDNGVLLQNDDETKVASFASAEGGATHAPLLAIEYVPASTVSSTEAKDGIDDPADPGAVDPDTGECYPDEGGVLTYCGENDPTDADGAAGFSALAVRTPKWGISDNKASIWQEQRTLGLNAPYARLIVPYDVVYRGMTHEDDAYLANVDAWISRAHALGKRILVSFEHCRVASCVGYLPPTVDSDPSTVDYSYAVRLFLARYPDVQDFTAWNEPNNPHQPTVANPYRAGTYYRELAKLCAQRQPTPCYVAAGDFLDRPDLIGSHQPDYFRRYRNGMGGPPQQWALHVYRDTKYGITDELDEFVKRTAYQTNSGKTPSRIWLTEQGAYRAQFVSTPAPGHVATFSVADQNEDVRWSLDHLACTLSDRIVRYYYYSITGKATSTLSPPIDVFDTGLLSENPGGGGYGATRDAYDLYKNKIQAGC
jgi:hypothetical protein